MPLPEWPTSRVTNWESFARFADATLWTSRPFGIRYLHRGQARAEWTLQPTLNRYVPAELSEADALALELRIFTEFLAAAPHQLPSGPHPDRDESQIVNWWGMMQHHGAPTRLLDWSRSAYVAAYFAVEQYWDCDGAIWIVEAQVLHEKAGVAADEQDPDVLFRSSGRPPAVLPLRTWHSERMVAQQGVFTASRQILGDHTTIIAEICSPFATTPEETRLRKLIIPAAMKPEFLYRLRCMNVLAASLFPGADGHGRALTEFASCTQCILAVRLGDAAAQHPAEPDGRRMRSPLGWVF